MTQFAATDWTPGLRTPDNDQLDGTPRYTDFRREAVEDRRADPPMGLGETLSTMGVDLKNGILGREPLPQVEPNELSKQLGYDDIELTHKEGTNKLTDIVNTVSEDARRSWYITKGFAKAVKEEWDKRNDK